MFRRLWERWKIIAQRIGIVQSRLLMNIFYFVILAPFGLGVKLGADPLRMKHRHQSNWLPKENQPPFSQEHARRQF